MLKIKLFKKKELSEDDKILRKLKRKHRKRVIEIRDTYVKQGLEILKPVKPTEGNNGQVSKQFQE